MLLHMSHINIPVYVATIHLHIWTILMSLIGWYIEWRWAFTNNNVWGVVLKVSSTFLPYSFHLVVIWKVRYDEFISYHDSYKKSLSVFYFWMNTLPILHYLCLAYIRWILLNWGPITYTISINRKQDFNFYFVHILHKAKKCVKYFHFFKFQQHQLNKHHVIALFM